MTGELPDYPDEIVALRRERVERGGKPLAQMTVEEARAEDLEEALEELRDPRPVARVEDLELPGPGGALRARLFAPAAGRPPLLVWFFGGGWVLGQIESAEGLARTLVDEAGVAVLLPAYRLAPEHPFPAAVEDATSAYRWLLEQGVGADRIVIAGDSAGGGLTLATLVALRDAGDPLPAAGVCLSPWVDLEGIGSSMDSNASADPIVQREPLLNMSAAYLGNADPRTALAAPLYADLSGLPPLLIQVGTAETLLDDSVRIADRARAAGVDVTLSPWDEMIHVWQMFPTLPEAGEAVTAIGAFVQRHTSAAAVV